MKMMPTVLLVAILLALVLYYFWPRDPYAMPTADWQLFKDRFVGADGRVIDTGNGDVSHTEGQGYGMLLAAAYQDRETFDRMWGWTRATLLRPDGLLSWRWRPTEDGGGAIDDPNNASDGEVLIAWALLRAHRQWQDLEYQKAAAQLVLALQTRCFIETRLGLQLLPGVDGFLKPDGVILNPSYAVFPAFTELATTFPTARWGEMTPGGLSLVSAARFGKWQLPPDWVLVSPNLSETTETQATPAASPSPATPPDSASNVEAPPESAVPPTPEPAPGPETIAEVVPTDTTSPQNGAAPETITIAEIGEPVFGYNAIRVPLHIAWADPESPLLKPFADFWSSLPQGEAPPATVDLVDGTLGPDPALPGMVAVIRLTQACVNGETLTVKDLPAVTAEEPYYSASLKLLTKLAIHERLRPEKH